MSIQSSCQEVVCAGAGGRGAGRGGRDRYWGGGGGGGRQPTGIANNRGDPHAVPPILGRSVLGAGGAEAWERGQFYLDPPQSARYSSAEMNVYATEQDSGVVAVSTPSCRAIGSRPGGGCWPPGVRCYSRDRALGGTGSGISDTWAVGGRAGRRVGRPRGRAAARVAGCARASPRRGGLDRSLD